MGATEYQNAHHEVVMSTREKYGGQQVEWLRSRQPSPPKARVSLFLSLSASLACLPAKSSAKEDVGTLECLEDGARRLFSRGARENKGKTRHSGGASCHYKGMWQGQCGRGTPGKGQDGRRVQSPFRWIRCSSFFCIFRLRFQHLKRMSTIM